jgi:hypothetical protein
MNGVPMGADTRPNTLRIAPRLAARRVFVVSGQARQSHSCALLFGSRLIADELSSIATEWSLSYFHIRHS